MNIWLFTILLFLFAEYLIHTTSSFATLRALSPVVPKEFAEIYSAEEYRKSQEYTQVRTRFSLLHSTVSFAALIIFLLAGGFNIIDNLVRAAEYNSIITGLLFTGTLLFINGLVQLPFSIYSTFVIEERFGFNTTSIKTFILDILKATILAVLLGGPLLVLLLWFFESAGHFAWFYAWIGVTLFSLFIQFLAPILIMPLFNKFSPLEEGDLHDAIYKYAQQENFALKGIFTMDSSKRSTKLNAFFTGIGKFRKIVFFDTLIERLTTEEIVAVLAHEMGHFKKKHTLKMTAASFIQTGVLFFLLSLVLENQGLFTAFRMEHLSIYASLIFFSFLLPPINLVMSLLFNLLSRQHEYEADAYAVQTSGKKNSLINGLKKLCQANMANLTPHPLTVFLEYSHPPILARIEAIKALNKNPETGSDATIT